MTDRTPTPICDFVRAYREKDPVRFHMPGHKGKPLLGLEPYDITEIDGADALFEADGIIAESEKNAGKHFGCETFYSAEGSSLCIRAMLYLASLRVSKGKRAKILASRNVHRTYLSAAALLDLDTEWIFPESGTEMLSSDFTPEKAEAILSKAEEPFAAVYVTSPDYLGHMLDIAGISSVCRKYKVPLLVDNAHGAYLRFLFPSRHPIDLGADLVCDSAHKTLPALTGAAYLHIGREDTYGFASGAKNAMALFGSTSPSYLILESLDLVNRELDLYGEIMKEAVRKTEDLKQSLLLSGYTFSGEEPLKLTILTGMKGYTGYEVSQYLSQKGIMAEFADREHIVFMIAPAVMDSLDALRNALTELPEKDPLPIRRELCMIPKTDCSIREAMLSPGEWLPTERCAGRVLAAPCVSCPPAVPVLMCGEIINEEAIGRFLSYGAERLYVVRIRG